jgi:hypothetical protein
VKIPAIGTPVKVPESVFLPKSVKVPISTDFGAFTGVLIADI